MIAREYCHGYSAPLYSNRGKLGIMTVVPVTGRVMKLHVKAAAKITRAGVDGTPEGRQQFRFRVLGHQLSIMARSWRIVQLLGQTQGEQVSDGLGPEC